MMNEEEELYKENILDHYKCPHNYKKLEKCTCSLRKKNSSCGDEITVYLTIKDGVCVDASFQGNGCAISQAATSMLTDSIKGKKVEEIKNITKEDVLSLLGVQVVPVRMKCALISLQTVQGALQKS